MVHSYIYLDHTNREERSFFLPSEGWEDGLYIEHTDLADKAL